VEVQPLAIRNGAVLLHRVLGKASYAYVPTGRLLLRPTALSS
jgi:hypothetical protein